MIAARFAAKVASADENGCRMFTGACYGGTPYGRFYLNTRKTIAAHRFAWEQKHGPLPSGLRLDHWRMNETLADGESYRCSRRCVEHVVLATDQQNLTASPLWRATNSAFLAQERKRKLARAVCRRGHVFTSVRPNGDRRCRTCENDARRGRR